MSDQISGNRIPIIIRLGTVMINYFILPTYKQNVTSKKQLDIEIIQCTSSGGNNGPNVW